MTSPPPLAPSLKNLLSPLLPNSPSISTSTNNTTEPPPALPSAAALTIAHSKIYTSLPLKGLGADQTLSHILNDLAPGFNGSATSATYYGFVTGGVLPVAAAADSIVTAWDQNVQVHLPHQGIATSVEWRAGEMLCDLLRLGNDVKYWKGRTFTTGATASNVLGLACGREAVLRWRMGRSSVEDDDTGVGEIGLLNACRSTGLEAFQVLTTMGHSSISKAASIVGLGRSSVKEVGLMSTPWKFDMDKLESLLAQEKTASIVVVGCGEVNTGRYATSGLDEMKRLRDLCDKYRAWLHVDGAFGLFARALLPEGRDEFALLQKGCEGIELADSITGDAHKCLNVPYDCGFFFTRSLPILTSVFKNTNAAYLAPSSSIDEDSIPSPLNINIENSRRFRALPVYAVLVAHGYTELSYMFTQQVRLARRIAAFIDKHFAYELLPRVGTADRDIAMSMNPYAQTGIIVLFRAGDDAVNADLATRINRSGKIMVSGTKWDERPAVRIAVSTWMVEEERRAFDVVCDVLEDALQ